MCTNVCPAAPCLLRQAAGVLLTANCPRPAGLGKKDKASGRSSALGGDKDGAARGGEEGPRAGGAGGDPQQQDGGGEQQALAEVDPEQQVGY